MLHLNFLRKNDRKYSNLAFFTVVFGFGVILGAKDAVDVGQVCFTAKEKELVEVVTLDPTIVLDIRYATDKNFTGRQVYSSGRCFLRRIAAERILAVQKELRAMGLGLKIFDGYRPFSVQEIFWKVYPREGYVARPIRGIDGKPISGSKHNRGAAVDLTIINLVTGNELEMPSEFDDLTERAHRNYDGMPHMVAKNCKLLENVMVKHGFKPLPTEWWHFDLIGWQAFDILDIAFEQIGNYYEEACASLQD